MPLLTCLQILSVSVDPASRDYGPPPPIPPAPAMDAYSPYRGLSFADMLYMLHLVACLVLVDFFLFFFVS